MSLLTKPFIQFLIDPKKISKACKSYMGPLLKMQVALSGRKDLSLLNDNFFMDSTANHCLNSTKVNFLLVHLIEYENVHNFGKIIRHTLRISKLTLFNKTQLPSNDSQGTMGMKMHL
ncbi:hypothetical protein [Candidatus Nitrosocosmicus arcticus]|uniref:Uncharacterized protein n=1 Tax=Candidatus Nitrosocosmicus arcticus TaxID=2035267 RepID=A0A557STT7_9ARCH|nr:hypothetical protein [Candidatus Nitrosocosmicus arcticus]TVP40023.1 hypothetical protein NARC_100085 [Candidatus Nitrosocosmicus arcticus]